MIHPDHATILKPRGSVSFNYFGKQYRAYQQPGGIWDAYLADLKIGTITSSVPGQYVAKIGDKTKTFTLPQHQKHALMWIAETFVENNQQ